MTYSMHERFTRFKAFLSTNQEAKNAGIVLVTGTVILGGLVFISPQPAPTPAVSAPVVAAIEPTPDVFAGTHINGEAAIVYDLKTGQVLFEKNAETQLPLASLTKMLTMYAASGTLAPTTPITIEQSTINDAADANLKVGETFAFADLARLALVASSNNGAEAIATAAQARSNNNTASLMAGAASAAGLSQTYAVNASGLDESTSVSGGYGSAHDVAVLAGALLTKAHDIAHATTESSISITSAAGVVHTLDNTNPDVVNIPNILFSKTGYTDLAGGNLAVVFDAAFNHPIAVVVLGSTRDARFSDVNQLISLTLDHFAHVMPLAPTALQAVTVGTTTTP